ncbi:hypothetical protein AB1N83_006430, partial [Pleurotus pulmonarius]
MNAIFSQITRQSTPNLLQTVTATTSFPSPSCAFGTLSASECTPWDTTRIVCTPHFFFTQRTRPQPSRYGAHLSRRSVHINSDHSGRSSASLKQSSPRKASPLASVVERPRYQSVTTKGRTARTMQQQQGPPNPFLRALNEAAERRRQDADSNNANKTQPPFPPFPSASGSGSETQQGPSVNVNHHLGPVSDRGRGRGGVGRAPRGLYQPWRNNPSAA